MDTSQAGDEVFRFEDDPEMERAAAQARETFRYFWREMAWEARRIVPALGMACVKISFVDPPHLHTGEEGAQVEHMWISDVEFDGKLISGTLINSPNELKSVQEGDRVCNPPERMCDWIYAIEDRAYGGFTVNLLRSRMDEVERAEHDDAWGLEFGDPADIQFFPANWFASSSGSSDHPMAINMADLLANYLKEGPSRANESDDRGWTLLHAQVFAGSPTCVSILLENGADPNAPTPNGMTPLSLTRSLGWDEVASLLKSNGAR